MICSTEGIQDIQDAIRNFVEEHRLLYSHISFVHQSPQIQDSARTLVNHIRQGLTKDDRSSHDFAPGQQVSLQANYRLDENARNGPLREGDIGIVLAENSWCKSKIR
jgi:hypothetical protein